MPAQADRTRNRPSIAISVDGVEVSKAAFAKSYRRGARVLAANYDRLLKNAGEKEVHDARTATRRAQAHLELLPRKLRTGRRSKRLEKSHTRVMRSTAKVRDMDILRGKLSTERELASTLKDGIDRRRRSAARAASQDVSVARELHMPDIGPNGVPRSRLQRRFEKVVARLVEDVNERLPTVLGDPSDVKELHKLRIDCKRLRYLLEAVSARPRETEGLEKLQDALGSIHDWDVSISYVRRFSPESAVLPKWAAEREREFKEFSRLLKGASRPVL